MRHNVFAYKCAVHHTYLGLSGFITCSFIHCKNDCHVSDQHERFLNNAARDEMYTVKSLRRFYGNYWQQAASAFAANFYGRRRTFVGIPRRMR